MKKILMIAVLVIINASCIRHNRSESPTVSQDIAPSAPQASVAPTPVASPKSSVEALYVTDSANVIDPETRMQLETRLAQLRQRENIDFAVVTVETSGSRSAADYSLTLARERGAAIKNQNSSGNLLLLIAVEDRNWHIQVSRNLEGELTSQVLTELSPVMTELFRQKRWGEGITKYVDAIVAKLAELRSHLAARSP